MKNILSKHKNTLSTSICFILAAIIAVLFLKLEKTEKEAKQKDNEINSLQSALQQKEKSLQACINDGAEIISDENRKYSFSTFGVFSPLLQEKEIAFTTYNYKDIEIIGKSFSSPESIEDHNWRITVWELSKMSLKTDRPSLDREKLEGGTSRSEDFSFFGGYENYFNNPRWISDRMSEWNKSDSYKNKHGITMYYSYEPGPKAFIGINLEFYNPSSPRGHNEFVSIFVELNELNNQNKTDPEVAKAKVIAKQIADTISLRPPTTP